MFLVLLDTSINHTALVLFTRSSAKEAIAKCATPKACSIHNATIIRHLINRTISTARQTSLPFYIWDESKQCGDNFGMRLSHAFTSFFNAGYKHVIVIGNDCPSLCKQDLVKAAELLQQGKNVLAPTKKGGAYLIGLSQQSYNHKALESIVWHSTQTYAQLKNAFALKPIHELRVADDINSEFDLRTQLYILRNNDVCRLLIERLLQVKSFVRDRSPRMYIRICPRNFFGMPAPPFAC